MGSVVGCRKEICFESNIKEINVDVKEKDLENLNSINNNKNELTKPGINEHDNGNNINDKEEENEEEESEEDKENKEEISEDIVQYQNEIPKIILIQKTFRHRHHKSCVFNQPQEVPLLRSSTKNIIIKKDKEATVKYERFHTIDGTFSQNNNLKKNIHKYSMIGLENNKNGKSKKEEVEEIISVEQPYLPAPNKNSSKVVNNFKAMDSLKSPLLQNNINQASTKQNLLKTKRNSQNYLRILNDFGDRTRTLYNNDSNQKSSKLAFILTNKEKKEIKLKKNQDDIKGNFILKSEKVVRYQGGFIKKTKKKNGFGIVTWSDQSTLHGTYDSSMINGICRFYNNKYKSTFMGEYINNIPKGFGVYKVKNLSLQGYWDCSNLNGIAIEVWEDGTYYQGEYENNKKDGIGLYRWPDGTIYQGEFSNGQMTGKGIIFYSDDCVFSGEMLNGYMNGYGIFSWGNGSLYMGYYLQDIKHGFGIYIWDSKMFICYIGFWEMGKQQGIGVKINGNKLKYCIWNKGKIASTLKGLYEIDRYLIGEQRGYYHFFTAGYIAKLRSSSFYNFNLK